MVLALLFNLKSFILTEWFVALHKKYVTLARSKERSVFNLTEFHVKRFVLPVLKIVTDVVF